VRQFDELSHFKTRSTFALTLNVTCPPNVGVSRSRGSGKTRSPTRTYESKTGKLNERKKRESAARGVIRMRVLSSTCCHKWVPESEG
jgi:hypothetical protein